MALQKQIVEIPLAGGIETKADPKVVQPGTLLVLENGQFDRFGAINKRNGYVPLPNVVTAAGTSVFGTPYTRGRALMKYKDGFLFLDGTGAASVWSPALGAHADFFSGSSPQTHAVSMRSDPLDASVSASASSPSVYPIVAQVDVANGVMVKAYRDYDGIVYYSSSDVETGAVITTTSMTGSGATSYICRVCASGQYVAILNGTGSTMRLTIIDTATGYIYGSISNTSLATDLNSAGMFDLAATSANGTWVVAYENTTPRVKIALFDLTGAITASTTIAEDPDSKHIGVVVSAAGDIYVAYNNGATNRPRTAAVTSALAGLVAAADLSTTAGSDQFSGVELSTNTVIWTYSITASSQRDVRFNTVTSGGTIGTQTTTARSCLVLSKPFLRDGSIWAIVAYTSGNASAIQSGAYLKRLRSSTGATDTSEPASALVGQAFLETQFTTILPAPSNVVESSDGVYICGSGFSTSENLLLDTYYFQPCLLTVDFNRRVSSAEIGGALFFCAGGRVHEFDGSRIKGNGVEFFPEPLTATQSAGGGTIADGVYQVTALYAYIDSLGRMTFGTPAPAVTVTISGGGGTAKIAVTVPYDRFDTASYVLLYCTDVGGSVFYEVTALQNSATSTPVTSNITSVSGITDNRTLYTTGNVLENNSPPSLTSLIRRGDRLYGVDHDGVINYTKDILPGESPAFVRETLVRRLYDDSGYFSIADLDGRLVAIGGQTIQAISGEGLDDLGSSDTLSQPAQIPTDLGGVRDTPIAVASDGLFYKSKRGIALVDRSLATSLIGLPVEAYKDLTTTSAEHIPGKGQLRFGHADGPTLVYDYTTKQWSVFTSEHINQVSACVVGETHYYATASGLVYQETSGFVDGNGDPVTMVVETPWMKLSGLQGFQRIFYAAIVGEWRSPHKLNLQVFFDYATDPAEQVAFDAGADQYEPGDPLQIRHHIGRKCQAIKFRIWDSEPAGTKESLTLSGVALEIGVKSGVARRSKGMTF